MKKSDVVGGGGGGGGGVESVCAVGVTEQLVVYDLIPAPPPFCGCVLASLRLELV